VSISSFEVDLINAADSSDMLGGALLLVENMPVVFSLALAETTRIFVIQQIVFEPG